LAAAMLTYRCRAGYWIQMHWFSCKIRWCFPEPQEASTEDCRLRGRDWQVQCGFTYVEVIFHFWGSRYQLLQRAY
jgi:hypothetical protein